MPIKVGDIFDQSQYQAAQVALRRVYLRNSYARAEVDRRAEVRTATALARVRYKITPGVEAVFGQTTVNGLKKVDRSLVVREFAYKPGEKFDPARSKRHATNSWRLIYSAR